MLNLAEWLAQQENVKSTMPMTLEVISARKEMILEGALYITKDNALRLYLLTRRGAWPKLFTKNNVFFDIAGTTFFVAGYTDTRPNPFTHPFGHAVTMTITDDPEVLAWPGTPKYYTGTLVV